MKANLATIELMNRMYRHQRHIYDLTRKYYLLGRDRLIEGLNPGISDNVLEIGCGTGRNLIIAAQKYPHARFFGIDVSTEMLTTAHEAIVRAGLASRVRVAHADVMALDTARLFGKAKFERVFISYSLSMMPRWCAVLDTAMSLLAAGGELQIIDFGRQDGLPRWFRSGLRRWLALFHVSPRDNLEPMLAMRAAALHAALAVQRPFLGYAQHAVVRLPELR